MIRIKTIVGEEKVLTIHYGDKWFTLSPDKQGGTADNLLQAGTNHLEACKKLLQKSRRDP
jgi:hypothetical protein